eukprot:scaffold3032_cov123-Skeletonema_marinoi.AAC.1
MYIQLPTNKELEQWQTSFHTIGPNYNGSLEAVHYSTRSVKYDEVVKELSPSKLDLIRSPTSDDTHKKLE